MWLWCSKKSVVLTGSGAAPVPAGLIGQAASVAGADLWAAVVTAKAQIAAAGGTATHLAASPGVIGAEESRTDADGRPLWPDGLGEFAGVTVVPTAGATEPLLYDAQRTYLIVRSDYEAPCPRTTRPRSSGTRSRCG